MLFWVAALFTLLCIPPCSASPEHVYPARPIKLVVPVPPGGTADAVPRVVAEKLTDRFRQTVLIENRPGAALNIAAAAVAHASPDGYTLLATPPGPLITSQFLYEGLTFDPTSLEPVTILGEVPLVLVTRKDFPARTLAEFIAYARARPGVVSFGSVGNGSPPHLTAALFASKASLELLHVPYKGMTPALTDLMGGHIDVMFHDLASVLPLLQAGEIKALGIASASRFQALPDVPAISETYPDFVVTTWYAVAAPPKTPPPILSKLAAAISGVVHSEDVAARLMKVGMTPVGNGPAETKAFIEAERRRWHSVMTAAKILQK